jgi:glycosyltransferase involved in cell wall biosynthesis
MISAAVREADVIVVPTQAVADDLQSWVGTPHRLAVVGEGASPDLVLPADADERARRLRLPGDGYLATLATLEPRKGLDVAVAALADSAAPDLPLVVAGQRGWGRVDLRQVAARHQIPLSRLRLLGRLDDADLAVVLSRASVVLVPSRAEGFGLPAVEAMQLDTPVVVTDVPALVEVAGDAADVVPVDDPSALAVAAAKAAADPGARAKQRAARVRRYDWKITATRLWELYREARAERTKGVPA